MKPYRFMIILPLVLASGLALAHGNETSHAVEVGAKAFLRAYGTAILTHHISPTGNMLQLNTPVAWLYAPSGQFSIRLDDHADMQALSMHFPPDGASNNGEHSLSLAMMIDVFNKAAENKAFSVDPTQNKWTLMILLKSDCGKACEQFNAIAMKMLRAHPDKLRVMTEVGVVK